MQQLKSVDKMVVRMQMDVQRRKKDMQSKVNLKNNIENWELSTMFTPKINKKKLPKSQSEIRF